MTHLTIIKFIRITHVIGWVVSYDCIETEYLDIEGELTLEIINKHLEKKGIKNIIIKYLVIGTNIKSIGKNAFDNYSNLTGNLTIPNTVEKIGEYAFRGCELQGDLIIPDSVYEIGAYAFQNCSFNGKLKISETMKIINVGTFQGCSGFIGDLIIPDSVEYIHAYSFKGCIGFTGKLILNNHVGSLLQQCNGQLYMSAFEYCNQLRVFSYAGVEQKFFRHDKPQINMWCENGVYLNFYNKADKKPIEAEQKPIEAEQKPIEAEQKPIEAEQKPIETEQKPIEVDETEIDADNETNSIKLTKCSDVSFETNSIELTKCSDVSFDCNFKDISGLQIHMNGCQNIKFVIN
jgi:hypothetical protein